MMRSAVVVLCVTAVVVAQERGPAAPHLRDGAFRLKDKDYAGAFVAYTRAIDAQPELATPHVGRAIARHYLKDYAGAIQDLDKAIEIDGAAPDVHRLRAGMKCNLHDYEGALEDYGEAIKIDARDVLAFRGLAEIHESLGDWKAAAADYDRALGVDPECVAAWTGLAVARFHVGDAKGADKAFAQALYRDARDPDAYLGRAHVRLLQGRRGEAGEDYDHAVRVSGAAGAVYARARFHYVTGNPRAAAAGLRQTIELGGGEYARLWLCLTEMRLDRKKQGVEELRAYLAQREKKDWFGAIGRFLIGDLSEKELLVAARTKKKHETRARECEAYWFAGALRQVEGEPGKAREHFEKCVATKAARFEEHEAASVALKN